MRRIPSLLFVVLMALVLFAQGDVPAHHNRPPKKGAKLPAILPQEALWGPSFSHPVQVRAYELAAKIPDVLYQLPCYCHCDRTVGHTSLRSCYESTHAAHCSACMKELFYAYQMTKKGKSPAQIRAGIIRGEWEKVDLETTASIR
jgi:hypothetical protein